MVSWKGTAVWTRLLESWKMMSPVGAVIIGKQARPPEHWPGKIFHIPAADLMLALHCQSASSNELHAAEEYLPIGGSLPYY